MREWMDVWLHGSIPGCMNAWLHDMGVCVDTRSAGCLVSPHNHLEDNNALNKNHQDDCPRAWLSYMSNV